MGGTATAELVERHGALEHGRDFVRREFLEALRPPRRLSLEEWSNTHRVLDRASSAESGRYDMGRMPFLREIAYSLTEAPEIEWVILEKGSQVGGTELACNLMGWVIDIDPSSMLLIESTIDVAKRVAKTRIDTMIRATPRLRRRVTSKRAASDEAASSLIEKSYPGGLLVCAGANSPSAFRSFTYRVAIGDEVDAWPSSVGDEGDGTLLMERGAKTYHDRKFFLLSTPLIEGTSIIHREYLRGDQRQFLVPCPHCGGFQKLYWRNREGRRGIVWPEGRPELAHYVCEHCDQAIFEAKHKTAMLEQGRWEPSAEAEDPQIRSYHLSSLYSPVGMYSWGDIASKFLRAKKQVHTLQVFVNHELAEPWRARGEVPDWELLYRRRESYAQGTVPAGGLILTAGVDIQGDRIEYLVRAWGRRLESWIVDYGVLLGDTSSDAPWQQLEEVLHRVYPHQNGHSLQIRAMAVDTRYRAQKTYRWCRDKDRVYAVMGDSTGKLQSIVVPPKFVEIRRNGKRANKGVRVWRVGGDVAKQELYGWLRQRPPIEQDAEHPHGFVHFCQELDDEFFRQLCAETLTQVKDKKGFVKYEWVKTRPRNEVLDMAVYSRAAAFILQLDRYTDRNWDALEHAAIDQHESRESEAEGKPARPRPTTKPPVRTFGNL